MDLQATRPRSKALLVLLSAILLACPLLALACGGGDSGASTTAASSGAATTAGGASTSETAPVDTTVVTGGTATTGGSPSATAVTFQTEDGITLGGHLYGSGTWGVVLCHMYPTDQTSWTSVAEELAGQGYLVLTFDFRGYGESGGDKDIQHIDRDVFAAVQYIRFAGASDVVLVGASMGGTASLMVATTLQAMSSFRLAGVVTLSAPVEFEGLSATEAVPTLVVPLLFIAAEEDPGAEGARQLQQLSGGKGDLQILPGSEHGTDLFTGPEADTVWELLLGFLQQNLEAGNL